jgi:hypothetical protein
MLKDRMRETLSRAYHDFLPDEQNLETVQEAFAANITFEKIFNSTIERV